MAMQSNVITRMIEIIYLDNQTSVFAVARALDDSLEALPVARGI